MYSTTLLVTSASLALLSHAWQPPQYDDMNLLWTEPFEGDAGQLPNTDTWNIRTGSMRINEELEVYTPNNVQLSGGGTLQIVPQIDNGWTSGRIESWPTVSPASGVVTRVESLIRFGSNEPSSKQGLWPGFWLMGNSIRSGTGWPECGEIDVMETINGQLTGYGTAHCGDAPQGGKCNE